MVRKSGLSWVLPLLFWFAPAMADEPVFLEGDFVIWAPSAPSLDYPTLDLPAAYKAEQRQSDSPVVEPLELIRVHMSADGTISRSGTQSRYYLNRRGVRDFGNMVLWVDSYSDVATIHEAYTLFSDGRRLPVDPQAIQVLPYDRDDIFSDYHRIIIPYIGLEPDTIAVLTFTIDQRPGVWPLPWSRTYSPQFFSPRLAFDFSLSWDEGVEAPLWRTDYDALDCTTPEARLVRCRATEIASYPEDPHVHYRDVLPTLAVAQRTSWTALSDRVRSFVESALVDDPELDETVARLLAGADTDEERLRRLHGFVSQDIRYVGLEHGLGGIIPRPAPLTLSRRFGDCKDKTTLFIALARRAGLQAYPVLTTFDRFDVEKLLLPGATYFDHMVACVTLDSGDEFCVDLTDPHNPYRNLSSSLSGAIRLDLIDGPASLGQFGRPRFSWVVDLDSEIRMTADGDIEERHTRVYDGPYAGDLRSALVARDRWQRREWLLGQYHETISDAADPEFDVKGLDDPSAPLTIRSSAVYSGVFDPDGPPALTERQGWLIYEAASAQTGNRHHGYRFPGLRYRERMTIHMPPGREIGHPGATIDFESTFGDFRRWSEPDGDVLNVTTEVSIPSRYISRDRIDAFNRFIGHINDNALIFYSAELR